MIHSQTYAGLPVSDAVFDEIARKLKAAEYFHAFNGDVIDMHGVALVREPNSGKIPPTQIAWTTEQKAAVLALAHIQITGGGMLSRDDAKTLLAMMTEMEQAAKAGPDMAKVVRDIDVARSLLSVTAEDFVEMDRLLVDVDHRSMRATKMAQLCAAAMNSLKGRVVSAIECMNSAKAAAKP